VSTHQGGPAAAGELLAVGLDRAGPLGSGRLPLGVPAKVVTDWARPAG